MSTAKAIDNDIASYRHFIEKAEELRPYLDTLLKAEEEFGKQFDSCGVAYCDLRATMVVSSTDDVVRLRRVLAKHGFRQRKHGAEPHQHLDDPTRMSYELEKLDLTVINLGASCRRVVTGKRMVEVEDFQIVCDE